MALLALGMWAPCFACRKHGGADERSAVVASSPGDQDADPVGFHYPEGRWRLATFELLDRTTLWVGHIAIRHQRSEVEVLRPPSWRPDPPNPPRAVAEALALAEKIRAQAASAPREFERLAREYSDDIVSKGEGGLLGGVRASQLSTEFLDVLTVLKPGEVSQVFRTPYGFHILKRYPRPTDTQVAGERIVIGYQGVYLLGAPSSRSRAEALELAGRVANDARKNPRDFQALVRRYSENVDRDSHGDLGVFSTLDPGDLPAEVDRLSRATIGEVVGPMDSRFGFEILKRVAVVPHQAYAMTAIEVPAEAHPGGRAAAMAEARKVAAGWRRDLEKEPGRFQELQRTHCCERIKRWTAGRGDAAETAVLDTLAFGEIAAEPIMSGSGFLLVKRLDPRHLPPEPLRLYEVPHPSDPDYEALVKNTDGTQVAAAARSVIDAARGSGLFSRDAMATIAGTLGSLESYLQRNGSQRLDLRATLLSTLASLEKQLGRPAFGTFEAFGRKWIIGQMMPPGAGD